MSKRGCHYSARNEFKRKSKRVLVRCLGGGKEHTFLSEDPCCNRVCTKCMNKITAMHFTLMAESPFRLVRERKGKALNEV